MPNNNKTKKVGYSEKSTMPPLGIISIGGYLTMHGYSVFYLDLFTNNMSKEKFEEKILDINPDMIGISTYTENFSIVIHLTKIIKKILPERYIVLGGPHVSFLPEEALKYDSVDFVSRGEGEITFVELIESLNYHTIDISQIDGVSYKVNNEIIHNEDRKYIEYLDCLPWTEMNEEDRKNYNIKQLIITSRGCPGQCVYCASAALSGRRYRARSAENIYSEIHYKYMKKGERYFAFLDDTFTANKKRLYKFCDYIEMSKLDIIWRCDSRTDILSFDMIDKIQSAGCISVHIGIESGSQEVINNISKNIDLKKSELLMEYMSQKGLSVMCSFIIGHHCDTHESIKQTIQLANQFKTKYGATVGISLNTPFPGTKLFNEREKFGVKLETNKWSSFDLVQAVISTKYLSREDLQNYFFEIQKIF